MGQPKKCEWCGDYDSSLPWHFNRPDGKYGYFCSRLCITQAGENGYAGTKHPDCFITTSICQTLNKPDDCEELTVLRKFRDSYMGSNPERKGDIDEYYEIAPQIVSRIEDLPDHGNAEYTNIWTAYLRPAVVAAKEERNSDAYRIYKEMVLTLKEKYLS